MGDDRDPILEALELLYQTRYSRFFRLAFAVTGSREGAADAIHEAFLRAIRGRGGVRDPDALEGWLWRTVLNVALTQKAQTERARDVPKLPLEEAFEVSGEDLGWPELRAAVSQLPERQRLTLFLRHYADLSYEQIAEVLQVARGTVAATLNQAHASLRKTLEVPR